MTSKRAAIAALVPDGPDHALRSEAVYATFRRELHALYDATGVRAVAGDTMLDLQAGHRAGVRWNVGVLSGAHGRAALEAAPHTHLIGSVALLPRVFGGAW